MRCLGRGWARWKARESGDWGKWPKPEVIPRENERAYLPPAKGFEDTDSMIENSSVRVNLGGVVRQKELDSRSRIRLLRRGTKMLQALQNERRAYRSDRKRTAPLRDNEEREGGSGETAIRTPETAHNFVDPTAQGMCRL